VATPAPLQKPEPDRLLDAPLLDLDTMQRQRIEGVVDLWRAEKAAFQRSMAKLAVVLRQSGRDPRRQPELQEYAALSRSYEDTRVQQWAQCLAILTPTQRSRVLSVGGRR
jgi:hypothetical protein